MGISWVTCIVKGRLTESTQGLRKDLTGLWIIWTSPENSRLLVN